MEPSHKKSTFLVEVQFQKNSTWQGTIHWLEEKKSRNFRSSLEMLKLMDDALTEPEQSDLDTELELASNE